MGDSAENSNFTTANDLFEYCCDKDIQLVVRKLERDNVDELECVLIGGRIDDLRFLRNLIDAIIRDPADDGFEISPTGPGSIYFSAKAETALYIFKDENPDS